MRTVGICFGAVTVQWVKLRFGAAGPEVEGTGAFDHQGELKPALDRLRPVLLDSDRVTVTGRGFRHVLDLSSISEPEAVEHALAAGEGRHPDALVSCGGENIVVYLVGPDGGIASVRTGSRCASGTGEFLVQQAGRMNMTVEEAVAAAKKGVPRKIAGRCSVFCKSDCTHALNKGEPRENICAGLCRMMADKVLDLLNGFDPSRVMLTGGGSRNEALARMLGERISEVAVTPMSPFFEAYGAALWAGRHPCRPVSADSLRIKESPRVFLRHPPLSKAGELVDFKEAIRVNPRSGDVCLLGLDVGSTTTKAVLTRVSDRSILASVYLRTNGSPVEASRACYAALAGQVRETPVRVEGMAVTGSGRRIAALHAGCPDVINEIICHARAAAHFDREADTIFEIGGQDAKYTYLSCGVPSDYAMNEACSAGTGSFLEEAAGRLLNVPVEEIAGRAFASGAPPDFNDQCAAFISSDIKLASQQGMGINDILAGLVYSICLNYLNRVKAGRRVGRKILMQGGVCYNHAVPAAMAGLLNTRITVPPEPGLMGAYGAALKLADRLEQGQSRKKEYVLEELSGRSAERSGSFICRGTGACDRKCEISRIVIDGQTYPFGGACGRYNERRHGQDGREQGIDKELDLVGTRYDLLMRRFGVSPLTVSRAKRPTVGISRSFLTQSLYPFYSRFFSDLGFDIVLSGRSDSRGMSRRNSEFCLPAVMAHGWFYDLLKESPDYIFLPHCKGFPVGNAHPRDSAVCPLLQGEPYYLRASFEKEIESGRTKILSPVLFMQYGYRAARLPLIRTAMEMGSPKLRAERAFSRAEAVQHDFERELKSIGARVLGQLEGEPGRFLIVLLGRPYNAFCPDANMGIPLKVASRGVTVIPFDMLPTDKIDVPVKMYWASGRKILQAARFIKDRKDIFAFYVTNFSCGPDSFLLKNFLEAMGDKPSLTLELDEHTADAGIDTRVEAALEIMATYKGRGVRPAGIPGRAGNACRLEKMKVLTPAGEKIPVKGDRVEILFPSMGRRGSEAVAAAFRSQGYNARALPSADRAVLAEGKKHSNCRECLPYMVTLGTFLSYLKERKDNNLLSLFFMVTGGPPCRLGKYASEIERVIEKNGIPNAGVFGLADGNRFMEMGVGMLTRGLKAILVSDVFEDLRSMLAVAAREKEEALAALERCWRQVILNLEQRRPRESLPALLERLSGELARIPRKRRREDIPVVSLVGEIFVRRSEFTSSFVVDYLERGGFAVLTAPVLEYMWYLNHSILEEKDKPLPLKWVVSGIGLWLARWERRIKQAVRSSGLYEPEMIDISSTVRGVRHLIRNDFSSETTLTVALSLKEIGRVSCGVISLGPFGCMASRPAEAILKTQMAPSGKARMPGSQKWGNFFPGLGRFPFLALETDGSVYPQIVEANLEAFILQARRLHHRMLQLK